MPEQIVGDEDVVADRREVAAHRRRSIARAPSARAAARSSRTSSGTGSRARSRPARPDDAPDRRTGGASRRRGAAPAAARRRARSVPVSPARADVAAVTVRQRQAGHRVSGRLPLERVARAAAARARRRRAPRRRRRRTRNGSGIGRGGVAADDDRHLGRQRADLRAPAPARRRSRARASRQCRPGRGACARIWCSSDRLNRRSASVTRWPRASSAAAMYSMPSGSMRKNGPRPNRSLPGTGRSSSTSMGESAANVASVGSVLYSRRPRIVHLIVESVVAGAHRRRSLVVGGACSLARSSSRPTASAACRSTPTSCRCCRTTAASSRRSGRSSASFGSLDQLYVVFTAPDGHAIADYADEIDDWVERAAAGAGDRAGRRRRRRSRRATSAGSPTASCCCCAAQRSTKRCAGSAPEGMRRGGRRAARAAGACRRRRSPQLVRQDPLGLFDLLRDAARRRAGRASTSGVDATAATSRRTAAAGW